MCTKNNRALAANLRALVHARTYRRARAGVQANASLSGQQCECGRRSLHEGCIPARYGRERACARAASRALRHTPRPCRLSQRSPSSWPRPACCSARARACSRRTAVSRHRVPAPSSACPHLQAKSDAAVVLHAARCMGLCLPTVAQLAQSALPTLELHAAVHHRVVRARRQRIVPHPQVRRRIGAGQRHLPGRIVRIAAGRQSAAVLCRPDSYLPVLDHRTRAGGRKAASC